MADHSSPAWMILITYNVRDGAEADGYEPWLRDVDNPFFNAVEGVRHYTNWKVVESAADLPFRYVDFLVVENVEKLEDLWFHPDLNAFRTKWVARWGVGKPDPANAHCYLCRRDRSTGQSRRRHVLVAAGAEEGVEVWETKRLLHKHYSAGKVDDWWTDEIGQGNPLFRRFGLAYADAPFSRSDVVDAARPGGGAFSCEIVATPD